MPTAYKNKTGLIIKMAAAIMAVIILLGLICWLAFRDDSLTRLQEKGVIRIGYAVEAPYAFLKSDGSVSGEGPEVARLVSARMGIKDVEWRLMEFNQLIDQLESGQIDVIAAGMFITPQRAQRVNFSEPTLHVRDGLLVALGNPQKLHSYQDIIDRPDIKVAVLEGSVEDGLLQKMGIKAEQRVVVPDALTGQITIDSQMADGLALSFPTIQWMALQDELKQTEIVQPFEESDQVQKQKLGYSAFAFRKSDRQLLEAWNKVLKTLVGSPEHLKLIAALGFTKADLPQNMTMEEVLAP